MVVAVIVGSVGVAQVPDAPDQACESELAAEHRRVSSEPKGLAAAALLRSAVEAVEPAFPPFRNSNIPDVARGYADAEWLAERRLLPAGWTPDALDPAGWKRTLNAWRGRYRLDPVATDGASAPRALALDLARTLHDLRGAVRPLGLIAHEDDQVVFVGLIWNFTPYPRLLLARPPRFRDAQDAGDPTGVPGGDASSGRASDRTASERREARIEHALALLSSCARSVESYLTAPSDLAFELFLSAPDSSMRVVASEPTRDDRWPVRVDRDEARTVFGFTSPLVEGVDIVSVELLVPSLSVGRAIEFLVRMGGNVNVTEFPYFLQYP